MPTADEMFVIFCAQREPLKHLSIDGRAFEVGVVAEKTAGEIAKTLSENANGISENDHLLLIVETLLRAANPNIDFEHIRSCIRPQHMVLAAWEWLRQRAVHALKAACLGNA